MSENIELKFDWKVLLNRAISSLLYFFILSSVLGLVLFVTECFSGQLVFLISLATSLVVSFLFPIRFYNYKIENLLWVIPIGLLFIATRYPVFNSVHGGQDQGVYLSMSKHIGRGGGPFITDKVSANLKGELLKEYKNAIEAGWRRSDLCEGFQPGVYARICDDGGVFDSQKKFDYVFQFYHLFPIWIALGDFVFGEDSGEYVVLLFGGMSCLFMVLLFYEITLNILASLLLAIIVIFNPIHAFFCRFPNSEIQSLALVCAGLWLLFYTYNRCHKLVMPNQLAVVAGIIFGMSFFARISGFVFLPFIIFLFFFGLWKIENNKTTGYVLLIFSLVTKIIYLLSVWYGLEYSFYYSVDIYTYEIFGFILYKLLGIGSVLLYLVGYVLYRMRRLLSELRVTSFFGLIYLLVYLLSLVFATLYYKGDSMSAFVNSSVFNVFLSAGLALPIIAHYFLLKNTKKRTLSFLLLLLSFPPLFYAFILRPTIPYYYYYSRYFISELIPFMLLVWVYAIEDKIRVLLPVTFSAVILGFVYITPQHQVSEGSNAKDDLSNLSAVVGDNLLVLDESGNWNYDKDLLWNPFNPPRLYLPLYFYYDKFVFPYREYSTKYSNISFLVDDLSKNLEDEVYVLSTRYLVNDRWILEKTISHNETFMVQDRSLPITRTSDKWKDELYLYYVPPDPCKGIIYNKHSDGIWTMQGAEIIYACQQSFIESIVLSIGNWRPDHMDYKDVQIKIGEYVIPSKRTSEMELQFDLPSEIVNFNSFKIVSDCFVPSEVDDSSDDRLLCLDLRDVRLI